jgi:uncharacterized protein
MANKVQIQTTRPGLRLLLIVGGWLSLCLGILGIFLPLLPTTCFILLSAWCFSRSSDYFYNWLLNQKYFGPIIRHWQNDRAIPLHIRNRALAMLWISLLISSAAVGQLWLGLSLITFGFCLSGYMLKLRTI